VKIYRFSTFSYSDDHKQFRHQGRYVSYSYWASKISLQKNNITYLKEKLELKKILRPGYYYYYRYNTTFWNALEYMAILATSD